MRLLDEEWCSARLQRVRSTLLVMVAEGRAPIPGDGHGYSAVAFDLTSRSPLSPVHFFDTPAHLGGLPSLGPEPVLARASSDVRNLVIADVRDGSVLKTFPLPDGPLPSADKRRWVRFADDLALGHHGGRDLLFLHEDNGPGYAKVVWAVDLATGAPAPDVTCDHFRYKEISERITLRHGYLAWSTTEETVTVHSEDFSVTDEPFVYVQRADGSWVGKVHLPDPVPEDRDVEIVHAVGRTYLAESGSIFTLPDLKPVFPGEDVGVVVSRVTEWAGRPVAVLIQQRNRAQGLPERLCHMFLDTDVPEKVVIPWMVPPEIQDLLVTPDGTIVVSSAEGVHVLDVDPKEAARSSPGSPHP